LLDAYTCNVLNHEEKTCDDTHSSLLSLAPVRVCRLTMIYKNP
jgi:hypothetical protein